MNLEAIVAALQVASDAYLRGDRATAVRAWRSTTVEMPYVPRAWAGVLSYGPDATTDEAAQGHYFIGIGAPDPEDPGIWTWQTGAGEVLRGRLTWQDPTFSGIDLFDLTFLAMGLGYWYERRGDYAAAAWMFEVRHGLMRQSYPWPESTFRATIDAVAQYAASSDVAGDDEEERILCIVGVPRCGSTILARALAAHPDVVEIGENPLFDEALRAASVADDGRPDLDRARELVRASLSRCCGSGAPRIICNKQLNTWLWAPLISKMFPRARFIDLRRDALEQALSCWRTDFAVSSLSWATSMSGIATYMAVADHAIATAQGLAPQAWLTVDYDRFAAEPEPTLRALLAWCGLPWDPAVLHPERRGDNPIDTASTFEAREPIRPPKAWAEHYPEQVAAFSRAWRRPWLTG